MSAMQDPAYGAYAVTPHDTNANAAKALYIGGAGDVAVIPRGRSTAVTFVGVAAGTILPVQVSRVMSTNTTATNIVGLV